MKKIVTHGCGGGSPPQRRPARKVTLLERGGLFFDLSDSCRGHSEKSMTVRRNRDKKKPRGRAVAQRSADSDAQNYPANTAPFRAAKRVFPSPPKLPDALATFGGRGG